MLSYQHAYHAGSRADVHKHAALALVLAALARKDRPLSYVESHAGRGLYDLAAAEAAKTGEAADGIVRVLARGLLPASHPYRVAVEAARARFGATAYPGSPLIARTLLRPADRLHLIELHKHEHAALVRALAGPGVHIHRRDGWEGVPAIVPPAPRRGLVLIDPSYELDEDWDRAARLVLLLRRKWPEATVMLWYPLLGEGRHEALCRTLDGAGLPRYRREEVRFPAARPRRGLLGSGLVLFNLPWGTAAALDAAQALTAAR